MKIIRNNIIPFKGFKAINLFGVLFVRKDAIINDMTITHETIHTKQMREMLYVPFYLFYVLEWLWRCVQHPFISNKGKSPYRRISFEREAYENAWRGEEYLNSRDLFSWVEYL